MQFLLQKISMTTLLLSGLTYANEASVYFKNGAVLKGEIIEQNEKTLRIKADGAATTYAMKDIEQVENTQISAPPPPPPAPVASVKATTIPAGTILHLVTTEPISTRSHKEGHQFKMQLESDLYVSNQIIAKRGTEVYAVVTSSRQAGRLAGNSSLQVTIRALIIEGRRVPVQTQTLNVLTEHNQARNTTAKVARGAAIGALVDGSSGARTGAKVGAGAAILTRGQAAGLPSGVMLDFSLNADAAI